jgi:PadR family transcriptional regulator AphA
MVATAVSLRYFILGLLTQEPMSGYDIRQLLDNLSWLIGSPSCGSLYPALRGLLDEGFVTMDVEAHQGRPPRKVYSITEPGRNALQGWMDQPAIRGTLKAFLMRLILANRFSHAGLIAHLHSRRAAVAGYRSGLEQAVVAGSQPEDSGQYLALDYAQAIACAELAWLDSTLERLSQWSRDAGKGIDRD